MAQLQEQKSAERIGTQLEHPERVAGNVGEAGSGTQSEYAPLYEDHHDDHTHHVDISTYWRIFGVLMIGLFLTVAAWWIDQGIYPLGRLSVPIALAIAFFKAACVVLIFMHVKFSSRLVQIFACTGLIFAAIMFLLTFNDYGTRAWLPQ